MTTPPQANPGSFRQTAIGLLALAALWNAVYWLWPVHRPAPVVMANAVDTGAAPEPTAKTTLEPEPIAEPLTLTMGTDQPEDPQIIDPIVHDPENQLGVRPPNFQLHTTTANDRNLGDIASRYYGDRALASVIAQANPFKDPSRLKAGQVWRVPNDPDNIQGQPVDAQGDPVEAPTPTPPPADYTEYLVRDRDTLSAISKLHYKTTQHADAIYAFNKDRLGLRSPRAIRPGQVLRIPIEPNEAR